MYFSFLADNKKYMRKKERNAEKSLGEDQKEGGHLGRSSPELLRFWDSREALGRLPISPESHQTKALGGGFFSATPPFSLVQVLVDLTAFPRPSQGFHTVSQSSREIFLDDALTLNYKKHNM